jgi:predicted alpha/beta superfamily hydrolase
LHEFRISELYQELTSVLNQPFSGRIELHKGQALGGSRSARDTIVYLPPGYSVEQSRYPVLYLNDGQNLFDPTTAFLGNDWGLGVLVDGLIRSGEIQPVIIAGIYNRGEKRALDYTPVRDAQGNGGGAAAYGRWIREHLKPFIDHRYRTLAGPLHTGLGGSSLGGLVSLYLGLRNPETFGRLLVMSPSVWWAGRAILKTVGSLRSKPPLKIWLDIGTCEGRTPEICVKDAAELCRLLVRKGWRLGEDLAYFEAEDAAHNEKAWAARMPQALRFLFPPITPEALNSGSVRIRRNSARARWSKSGQP